jgi:hypothetical protein
MGIPVPEEWVEYLIRQRETGMGYQVARLS